MKKRLQIVMSEEVWNAVEAVTNEANENFDAGTISYSDTINEMILNSKVDIKALQLRHTSLRRSLRSMALKGDLDIDSVIKNLQELKNKAYKRNPKSSALPEDSI